MDIEANVRTYLGKRGPTARYASFDYCYNHFQRHRERGALSELVVGPNMQLSCLHLGFYLASWGMLRASPLLRRSAKHYVPVIQMVASSEPELWNVDADCYTHANWDLVWKTARQIREALPDRASDTLIRKIMLGVFGCVPAFDTYFKKGFGGCTFSRKTFMRVAEFYEDHAEVIDRYRVKTLEFDTGVETARRYTREGYRHDLFRRGRGVTRRSPLNTERLARGRDPVPASASGQSRSDAAGRLIRS